jgi:predicted esterase
MSIALIAIATGIAYHLAVYLEIPAPNLSRRCRSLGRVRTRLLMTGFSNGASRIILAAST